MYISQGLRNTFLYCNAGLRVDGFHSEIKCIPSPPGEIWMGNPFHPSPHPMVVIVQLPVMTGFVVVAPWAQINFCLTGSRAAPLTILGD